MGTSGCPLRTLQSIVGRVASYVPGSKVLILGMVIPPLIGTPCNVYITPYYNDDEHPCLTPVTTGVNETLGLGHS